MTFWAGVYMATGLFNTLIPLKSTLDRYAKKWNGV